jgi:hypothetical protein
MGACYRRARFAALAGTGAFGFKSADSADLCGCAAGSAAVSSLASTARNGSSRGGSGKRSSSMTPLTAAISASSSSGGRVIVGKIRPQLPTFAQQGVGTRLPALRFA